MNRQETSQILSVLFAAFPNARPHQSKAELTLDVWSASMADISADTARKVVQALIDTRTFMPSIAEIRSMASQASRGRVRSGAEAWPGVVSAMRQEGAYRTPGVEFVFADPIAARCVQLMDWQTLCLSENTVADRARFIELYDKLATEVRAESASPALVAMRGGQSVSASLPADRTGSETTLTQLYQRVLNQRGPGDGE